MRDVTTGAGAWMPQYLHTHAHITAGRQRSAEPTAAGCRQCNGWLRSRQPTDWLLLLKARQQNKTKQKQGKADIPPHRSTSSTSFSLAARGSSARMQMTWGQSRGLYLVERTT